MQQEEVVKEQVVTEEVVLTARQVLFALLEPSDSTQRQRVPQKTGPGLSAFSGAWPQALASLAAGVYCVALDGQGRLRLPKAALELWGMPTEHSESWLVITHVPLGVIAVWKPEFFTRFEEKILTLFSASGEEEAPSVVRGMYFWRETGELGSRARLTLPSRLRREHGLDGHPVELLLYTQGLMVVKRASPRLLRGG